MGRRLFGLTLVFVLPLLQASQLLASEETVRSRNRGTCAILLSKPYTTTDGVTRVDDTNGVPIAPLDIEKFTELLKNPPKMEGILIVTGLPMWGEERERFETQVRELMKSYGFGDVPIRFMVEPKGKGLDRVLQELRYFFPLGSDYQKPVRDEVKTAGIIATASNISLAIFAFANFPISIAVPMVATGTGLDLILAIWRRSFDNWVNRSTGRPWEKILKESAIGAPFIAGLYATKHWNEIVDAVANSPIMDWTFWTHLQNFGATQWPTILMNGLLFSALFNGLYLWEQMRSITPKGDEIVRRTVPWIIAGLYFITAPAFAMAATSTAKVFDSPELSWLNPGHLYLSAMALIGSIFWIKPYLFDKAVPVVDRIDRYVFYPIKKLAGWFRRRIRRAKVELPKPQLPSADSLKLPSPRP